MEEKEYHRKRKMFFLDKSGAFWPPKKEYGKVKDFVL